MKITEIIKIFNVHRETIAHWIKIKEGNGYFESKKRISERIFTQTTHCELAF